MTRRCTVCSHDEQHAINEVLVIEGQSNRRTASQYGLSEAAIRRHRAHIPQLLLQAKADTDLFETETWLRRVESLERDTLDQLEALKKGRSPDRRTILSAIREQRENLRLVADVIEKMNEAAKSQVGNSYNVGPAAQTLIINALMQHPEARQSVADAIGRAQREIEGPV